jgi:hypothetical protein
MYLDWYKYPKRTFIEFFSSISWGLCTGTKCEKVVLFGFSTGTKGEKFNFYSSNNTIYLRVAFISTLFSFKIRKKSRKNPLVNKFC